MVDAIIQDGHTSSDTPVIVLISHRFLHYTSCSPMFFLVIHLPMEVMLKDELALVTYMSLVIEQRLELVRLLARNV